MKVVSKGQIIEVEKNWQMISSVCEYLLEREELQPQKYNVVEFVYECLSIKTKSVTQACYENLKPQAFVIVHLSSEDRLWRVLNCLIL